MNLSLLFILKRFLDVLRAGWHEPEFRGVTIFLGFWALQGTVVYSLREDWGIVDSFYFSVMTLTTIGYGDLVPTSAGMKVYTVIYAVLGIGLFVMFNARIAQIALRMRVTDRVQEIKNDSPNPE